MASVLSAGTTSNTALNLSADTTGVLQLASNGSTTALTIDTSQNVGIGTASPSQKLHVSVSSGNVYTQISSGSNNIYYGWNNANSAASIESPSAITFLSGGSYTERMRITSGGYVGIGVTPAAWDTFPSTLQFGNSGCLASNNFGGANTQMFISNNMYYGSGAYRYLASSTPVGRYAINSGEHYWTSAASGTAGNSISETVLMSVSLNNSVALQGATFKSGTGITFPATQSASSDANTLDDYEEGTWTPTISNGFTSPTYSVQVGTYTKIGNVVTFSLRIDVNGGTRAGSTIRFTLPFTSKTISNNPGGASWAYVNNGVVNSNTTNLPTLYINPNSATMDCYNTTGSGFLGNDLATATPEFYIGGVYLTN